MLCRETFLFQFFPLPNFHEQKVVKNEHVLAIVKLKEEKMDREEQAMKLGREHDQSSDSRNRTLNMSDTTIEIDDSADIVPKLTRAKAKALNTYPLPVAPMKKSDSGVAALIQEELHSDDDDEEYQPGEDDIEVRLSECPIEILY